MNKYRQSAGCAGLRDGRCRRRQRLRAIRVSGEEHHAGRAVFAGRQHRSHHAHRGQGIDQPVRPAGDRRQPGGRRRRDRLERRRAVSRRRLYRARHGIVVCDRGGPDSESAVRPAQGFPAGHDGDHGAARAGGDAVAAGEKRQGISRAGQGAAGRTELRLGRQRHQYAPGVGTPEESHRHQNGPRAVQRRRRGAAGLDGRPGAGADFRGADGSALCERAADCAP